MKKKGVRNILILTVAALCAFAFTACTGVGVAVDPGQWGYECMVTYDALGGIVNAREVRKTYYLPNSYVFKPSGSSNMLVEPARDGYVLAGWYTAKADKTADSVEEYTFSGADRWDFNTDRVQGDITLYARWLPRGKVDYVDADTGEVLFSKNITTDSPIQPLSDSVMSLSAPAGKSFSGYYADAACTQVYDFSAYEHVNPNPTEAELYAALYEMFPQYLEQIEYVEPDEEEQDDITDTSWTFLNKLGYNLLTDDPAALQEIADAKDSMLEDAILGYLENTAERVVYMKFTEGNYIRVSKAQDLKHGASYGFFDVDAKGNPIDGYSIESDIDLTGVAFTMSENFSGTINGNGHTLSNLTVSVTSRKIDNDKEKKVALFALMDNATINDLTIADAKFSIQVKSGITVTGALFALEANNVTFNNVTFQGLTIDTGRGDDGAARYTLGDLFVNQTGCTFNNCTAEGLTVESRTPEQLRLAIFTLPEPEPVEEEDAVPAP